MYIKIKLVITFTIGMLLLLISTDIYSSITLPGLDTEAMGRGTAFVAKADNLSCMWYNPAGLTKLNGLNIGVSVFQDFIIQSFQREPVQALIDAVNDPDDSDYYSGYLSPGESNAVFFPLPYLAGSYKMQVIDLTIGFSPYFAMPLPDFYRSFGKLGASRYTNFNEEIMMFFPQVAVGWQPFEWLRIGGSFEVILTTGYTELIVNAAFPPVTPSSDGEVLVDSSIYLIGDDGSLSYEPTDLDEFIRDRERPSTDIIIKAEAEDYAVSFWGGFGIIVEPVSNLEIGFSFRPGTTIRLEAELHVDSFENKTDFFDPDSGYNTNSPLHDDPVIGLFLKDTDGSNLPLIEGFYSDNPSPLAVILKIPPVINFGLRYIIDRYGDVEIDFSWFGNEIAGPMSYEADFYIAINETLKNLGAAFGVGDVHINEVTTNETNRNDWIISAGSDWNAIPEELIVRYGTLFAYGTQASEDLNGFYDIWHLGFSAGLTYIVDNWIVISFAYSFLYFPSVSVRDTNVSAINLPGQLIIEKIENELAQEELSDEQRLTLTEELNFYKEEVLNHIQNGDYSRMDHMLSLGLTFIFDL